MAEPSLVALTDEQLAALMQAPVSDVQTMKEAGCPSNPDGTWKYLTVLAWVEHRLGIEYANRGKK